MAVHLSELFSSLSPQVRRAIGVLAKSSGQAVPRMRADSVRETVGFDAACIKTKIVPRHELSPETADKVLAGYRAGQLVKHMAQELGISDDTIYRIISRADQPLRRSTPRMGDALRRKACELYGQGLSLAKVSAKLGVPATTIKRALLASGVSLRGPSERI